MLFRSWSSATLYDEDVALKRKNWFQQWMLSHPHPSQEDIIHFHQFTGDGDTHNDLMMNRDGKVFTVSVTSAFIGTQQVMMQYLDVKKSARLEKHLNIVHPIMKG